MMQRQVVSAMDPRRTVVVGDMVVAEDSDSEPEVIEVSDEDAVCRPKVLRVVPRNQPVRPGSAPKADLTREPAWHALLRRTPSSRTASIARTLPRGPRGSSASQPRPATPRAAMSTMPRIVPLHSATTQILNHTPSRIIRTDAHHRPAVNVPAKVLVPRTRLLFPLLARGRTVSLQGPAGTTGRVSFAAPRQGAVSVPQGRIVVSAAGPLSRAESAVLDGVLDLLHAQELRQCRSKAIQSYMELYGVQATDKFPDDLPFSPSI